MATQTTNSGADVQEAVLNIECQFQGVSIGDETARLGLKISRDHITLEECDMFFDGHRLAGSIQLSPRDDHPKLAGMDDSGPLSVETVFDCKRFSCSAKDISCGFTFALDSVDVRELSQFAKRGGWLAVRAVGQIDNASGDGGEGEQDVFGDDD